MSACHCQVLEMLQNYFVIKIAALFLNCDINKICEKRFARFGGYEFNKPKTP